MEYEPRELLLLWRKLAAKYTSNDSTSVSYEKAQQLMEAVLYCLNQKEQEQGHNNLPAAARREGSLLEAYEAGLALIGKKAKAAKEIYDSLLDGFTDFGCRSLRDTVLSGMPEFFRRYDMRFAPGDHLLTLDYPVLGRSEGKEGIDLILYYMQAISLEQDFLKALPEEYCLAVFRQDCPGYRDRFENLAAILLHHAQRCMMAGKRIDGEEFSEPEIRKTAEFVRSRTREELIAALSEMTGILVEKLCAQKLPAERCRQLEEYLMADSPDHADRLKCFCVYTCKEAADFI